MKSFFVFVSFLPIFNPLIAQVDQNLLRKHVEILAADSLEGRGLGTLGKEKAVRYIEREFADLGLSTIGDSFRHQFAFRSGLAWIPATNLVAVLPGSDPKLKEEFILIGAHYDHLGYTLKNDEKIIYPGADDNASGVAAMIEIARLLKNSKVPLQRSIAFIAFDAEESGLIGAERILSDKVLPAEKIKLMFSLDMVGMLAAYGGLDLKGIESLVDGLKIARKHVERHGLSIKKAGSAIESRTDTKPFGDVGIPAVHVFTGLKSPYHKPGDKADLLDYAGMEKIVLFMTDMVVDFANQPQLNPLPILEQMAINENNRKTPIFQTGVMIYNGSGYHKYENQFFRSRNAYNFSGGIFTRVLFNRSMAVQMEALYDLNSAKAANGTFRRNSLTIPLNLQWGTPTASSGFRAYLFAGAYYRYHFSAKEGNQSFELGSEIRSDEWGYNWGIGIDISKYHLGCTWRRGLTDIYPENLSPNRVLDRNVMLSLGYRFR